MRNLAQAVALAFMALFIQAPSAKAQPTEDNSIQSHSIVLLAGQEAVQHELAVDDAVALKLKRLAEEFRQAADQVLKDAGIKTLNPNTLTANQRDQYANGAKAVNTRFGPQLSDLLSPDQLDRLRQIQFQYRVHQLGGPRALRNLTIAPVLGLSGDQDEALRLLGIEMSQKLFPGLRGKDAQGRREFQENLRQEYTMKALEILTPDQNEKYEKLRGAPFDVSKIK